MKKLIVIFLIISGVLNITGCKNSTDPSEWSDQKTDTWFEKGEWLNGWTISPDASIDRKELAISYFRHSERWDKAFTFLRSNDLNSLEIKRYDIDGDNLFATVSEYITRDEEEVNFEAHRKYIDIQYIISGSEKMSVAPLESRNEVLSPYDDSKDIEFMTVNESSDHIATPEKFFIFFPDDAHRPTVKVNENSPVKKIVLKVGVE